MNKIVVINEDLCTGCSLCVDLCPPQILYIDDKDNICKVKDETKCDRLKGCMRICPTGSITIR